MSKLVEKMCLELFQKTGAILAVVIVVTDHEKHESVIHEDFSFMSRRYRNERFATLLREMADQIEKESSPAEKEKGDGDNNRSPEKE